MNFASSKISPTSGRLPVTHEARADEVQIRSTAIAQKISHATNLSGAEASVKAIRSLKSNHLTLKSLQEYHA